MASLRGYWRTSLALLTIVVGFIVILLIGWVGIRIQRNKLAGWITTVMARLYSRISNIEVACRDVERLQNHQGFIFPNHSGYLDIVMLLSVMPVRFLAAAETRKRPLIGYLAGAIDTVFVDRSNQDSREQARDAIAESFQATPYPPIVVFPEGKLGNGHQLLPFFYGGFEIAIENGIPYIPCAIRFSHPHISTWGYQGKKEGIIGAAWRLATFSGPLKVEVIPLEVVQPKPDDEPAILANRAKDALEDALGFERSSYEMPKVVTFG